MLLILIKKDNLRKLQLYEYNIIKNIIFFDFNHLLIYHWVIVNKMFFSKQFKLDQVGFELNYEQSIVLEQLTIKKTFRKFFVESNLWSIVFNK